MTDTDWQTGASADGTLRWGTGVTNRGGRRILVSLWNGTSYETVLDHSVPAPVEPR